MKKLFIPLLISAFFLNACSNDFDLTAPWQDIPIMYGVLSPRDTAHYVRVEKAFLDPDVSALEVAQIADSIYYDDSQIGVFLERTSDGQRVQMQRVDGNLEGYVREGGIFADAPNWLYKYKSEGPEDFVMGGEAYALILERGDDLPTARAETALPDEFRFLTPNPIQPEIQFVTGANQRLDWRTDVNGVFFEVRLTIRYREVNSSGQVVNRDTLDWLAIPNVRRSNNQVSGGQFRGEAFLPTSAFYNFLLENIPVTPGLFRFFEGCDIILTGGGTEIEELQQALSANAGIVGAESFPQYTNVSEGLGVFTGLNTSTLSNVLIKPQTVDSMNDNPETQELNFRK